MSKAKEPLRIVKGTDGALYIALKQRNGYRLTKQEQNQIED